MRVPVKQTVDQSRVEDEPFIDVGNDAVPNVAVPTTFPFLKVVQEKFMKGFRVKVLADTHFAFVGGPFDLCR